MIFLEVVIIGTWICYAFVYRKDWHNPEVRKNIRWYFAIALLMIVFVGTLAYKFRGVQMVPGTEPSRHYSEKAGK
jgi:hypothetical protein